MIHNIRKLESLMGKEARLLHKGRRFTLGVQSRPQCSMNCPAGVNVSAYVSLIVGKRYQEALELVREQNPFPGICGRVCTHPCEGNCQRGEVDAPVSIKSLKRFVADHEVSRKPPKKDPYPVRHQEKVAVIGSGPAGLTTALDLCELGYQTQVFEAQEKPGGMLVWGIPEFRLPRTIVKREIEIIRSRGVEIETGRKVNNPASLLNKGFSAVVLAAGSWKGIPLRLKGEETPGVVDCLDFLRHVYRGELKEIFGTAVIIGGGDSAFDAARTALRLGAKKVVIAYRRTENEMPATKSEIRESREEGIEILELVIPSRVLPGGENGRIKGIELIKAELGEPDSSGRRRPVALAGSEFVLDCDWLIPAIGARPDLLGLEERGIELSGKGLVLTGPDYETTLEKIFAVGDVTRGPSTIVDVIGDGHLCAAAVHNYLREGEGPKIRAAKAGAHPEKGAGFVLDQEDILPVPRNDPGVMSPEKRSQCFEEMECGYSELVALKEASRCRRCGSCSECEVCLPTCDSKQILGTLDSQDFLIKVPCEVSREVQQGVCASWELEMADGKRSLELCSLTPEVDPKLCIACGRCEEACAYRAVRVGLKAGGKAYAYIDHDICRSCGRCVLPCPSGAIKLSIYDDETIQKQLVRSIKDNKGIAVFASYWDLLGMKEDVSAVELMCPVGLGPAAMVNAFAAGAQGVLVLHREGDHHHYLPIDYDVSGIVADTKELLDLAGIDPLRLMASDFSKEFYHQIVGDFSALLQSRELEPYQPVPTPDAAPLGRALFQLNSLAAQEGRWPSPLLLEGLLLKAAGIPDTLEVLGSAGLLARELGLESQQDSVYVASEGEEAVVLTEDGYHKLRAYMEETGEEPQIASFIQKLLENLEKLNFNQALPAVRVGLLARCEDNVCGFFRSPLKELLAQVPGCTVVDLLGRDCGSTGWEHPSAKTREMAMGIYAMGEDQEVDVLVTASAGCLTHLRATNRPGAWRHSSVLATDPYSFIVSRLAGGERNE